MPAHLSPNLLTSVYGLWTISFTFGQTFPAFPGSGSSLHQSSFSPPTHKERAIMRQRETNGRKDCRDIREVSFWVDGRAGSYNAGALDKGGSYSSCGPYKLSHSQSRHTLGGWGLLFGKYPQRPVGSAEASMERFSPCSIQYVRGSARKGDQMRKGEKKTKKIKNFFFFSPTFLLFFGEKSQIPLYTYIHDPPHPFPTPQPSPPPH